MSPTIHRKYKYFTLLYKQLKIDGKSFIFCRNHWLQNKWPTPSSWLKIDWPTPDRRLKITWPTPSQQNSCFAKSGYTLLFACTCINISWFTFVVHNIRHINQHGVHLMANCSHCQARFRRRTSHELNRMLMRENKGFFSFAFDSANVKYGVWTWPQSLHFW